MSKVCAILVNFHDAAETTQLANILHSLASISEVKVIDNSVTNLGFARAVNVGIKEVLAKKPPLILLINPDVIVEKKSFEKFLETSDFDIQSPIIKFQRQKIEVFDQGGKVNRVLGRAQHSEKLGPTGQVGHVDYVSGACMLIKREVIEKVGFFDERFFMYFEDVDFCLRAREAGFSVGVDSRFVVKHQILEHRLSHDTFKIRQQLKSNWKFILKWVPWYFKPLAYLYFLLLFLKVWSPFYFQSQNRITN